MQYSRAVFPEQAHRRLIVDYNEVSRFFSLLFCRALDQIDEDDPPVHLSLRAFRERGPAGDKPSKIKGVPVNNAEELIEAAVTFAQECASNSEPWVFAPPIALFDHHWQAKEEHIAFGVCLSVELDKGNIAQIREQLEALLGPCTCVVASGGELIDETSGEAQAKLHLHWRLGAPTIIIEEHALLKRARGLLCDLVGGDVTGKPIVHPYRWPGSWHRKAEPRLCRIVDANPGAEVDLEEVVSKLQQAVETAPPPARLNGHASGLGHDRQSSELIRRILNGEEYHSALRDLAYRYVSDGYEPNHVRDLLYGMMDAIPDDRREGGRGPGAWAHRRSQIPSLVHSAFEKKQAEEQRRDDIRNQPVIRLSGGSHSNDVREAEQALAAATAANPFEGVFQRGDQLARVVRHKELTAAEGIRRKREGIERAVGALKIVRPEPSWVRYFLGTVTRWERFDRREMTWLATNPPLDVAKTLCELRSWPNLPSLTGIVEAPTLVSDDGRMLATSGYDPDSGLYFDPGATEFPPISDHPTKGDALAALGTLEAVISGFPFKDEASRSVALAMMMTPAVRYAVRAAPLFAITAPKMASGKTLLAHVVSYIWNGKSPSVMSQASDETEDKKRLLALLMEGSVASLIDNCERPLKSAAMCTILTEDTWSERRLGVNEKVTVPTTTTWIATGNNLVIEGDLSARTLLCALDPMVERPEEREFEINLHDDVPRRRGELAVAALCIVRAFIAAGSPAQDIPIFGRFEEWSKLVRAPLVWLGRPDPYTSREEIVRNDPVGSALGGLLVAWHDAFGENEMTIADAVKWAAASDFDAENATELDKAKREALRDAFDLVGGMDHPRRVGTFIGHHKGRIERGLRFEPGAVPLRGVTRWRVKLMST